MANSAAFACSIFLLIVCLSYTDGHKNGDRRNDKRTNDERRNNEKDNAERQNDEKRNDDSSEEDKRSNDERRNDERRDDERQDGDSSEDSSGDSSSDSSEKDETSNKGRRNAERQNDDSSEEDERSIDERRNDERRNYKRRNDDSSEEHKIANYERSTFEKRKDEKQTEEKRTYESDDSSEEDKRSNDERRTRRNERRNDERQNDDSSEEDKGSNDERPRRRHERRNDDKSEEERRCDERRRRQNNQRRNTQRPNTQRTNTQRTNNQRTNNQRRNGHRRNPSLLLSTLMKIGYVEELIDDSSEEDRLPSFADKCAADKKEDWSYRGNNGPLMWTRKYSECGGRKQSPIAINSNKAVFHQDTEKLNFQNYQIPVETATIENNGHTIHMTPADDVERVIHFKSRTYRLKQLHFHWGNNKSHSSEHTIDTVHYALEMHLVHQSGNGRTAVVAVFFKEQRQASKELQNIIQKFPNLMYKDNSTELISRINLNNLLPANPASYYCYEGSLTTPPCTEGVQWLLLPKIMPVGTKQMAEFRKLYSSSKADSNEHCKISNNYRPLQSLNGRTVVISQ